MQQFNAINITSANQSLSVKIWWISSVYKESIAVLYANLNLNSYTWTDNIICFPETPS